MIIETRALRRMGLWLLGVLLVVAGIFTNPFVILAGFALIGVVCLSGVRIRSVNLRVPMPEMLKGVGLGLAAVLLILVTGGLLAAGGILGVVGLVLLLGVLVAAIVAVWRFFVPLYKVSISTLYSRWVKGKRDFQEAIFQCLRGDLQQSLASLARYEARAPEDPKASAQRAFVLLLMNRLPEAADEAERSLAIATTATGLAVRGQVLLAAGESTRAYEDLKSASDLEPRSWWIRITMAAALVEERRLETAVDVLKSANRGTFRMSTGALLLGDAHRLRGREREALKHYKEAFRLAASLANRFPVNRAELGRACVYLGRLEDAERALKSALEHANALAFALCGLALLSSTRGDDDAILRVLNALLAIRPHMVVTTLMDPLFTPLQKEKRFRELLAWALGAQRQTRERVLARLKPPA
jgi:tetratricopeptide (TPR) repeat protein